MLPYYLLPHRPGLALGIAPRDCPSGLSLRVVLQALRIIAEGYLRHPSEYNCFNNNDNGCLSGCFLYHFTHNFRIFGHQEYFKIVRSRFSARSSPLLPGWFCSAGAPLTDSWVFCCINKLHCFPQNPLCFPTSALLSEIPAQAWGSPKSLKLLLITVTPDTVNLARQALHPQSTKLPQTTTIIFGKQRYGETNYINQPEPTKTKQNQLRWPKLAVTSLPLYFSRALTGRIIRG